MSPDDEGKGSIPEIEPPRLLVRSHWSPLSGLPDSPENYEQVSWQLSERGDGTALTIRESNLASEEAKANSEQSWRIMPGNLNSLLEG